MIQIQKELRLSEAGCNAREYVEERHGWTKVTIVLRNVLDGVMK